MGFYHPASLVKDAERHGVEVRPLDVQRSGWNCRWEDRAGTPAGAVRLGFKFVHGLRQAAARAIEEEQARAPFLDAEDLLRRCNSHGRQVLHETEVQTLASIGALAPFGLTRRAALWQVARLSRPVGPLLEDLPESTEAGTSADSPLPEMTILEETQADFAGTQLTLGPHPLAHMRPVLKRRGVVPAADLGRWRNGDRVRTAGSVIVRQRPGTAKGLLFLTLEDETGMSQAIVSPDLLKKNRQLIVGSAGLVVEGVLQKRDGTLSVRGEWFWSLREMVAVPSHDFR
jgi:error-prone DNA polymerase